MTYQRNEAPEPMAGQPKAPALPEPTGFRTRYRSEPEMIGHYPWTYADAERRRRKYDRPECEYEDLFTADQMREYAEAAVRTVGAENEALRQHASKQITDHTLMTGLNMNDGAFNLGYEGGAAQLLAEAFADKFKQTGGVNYVEMAFQSREVMPGESFIVTLQRVQGMTPTQRLKAAQSEIEALRAELSAMKGEQG